MLGVVLAAGGGSRMGRPKALVREPDGTPWVELAVRMLREAGCPSVLVVLGAEADAARALVPPGAAIVTHPGWSEGLASTVRVALDAAAATPADAVLLTLVDLPGLPASVARRVLDAADTEPATSLARAVFDGRPGHPVLIGRAHWTRLSAALHGDAGASAYLRDHRAVAVECGDLSTGLDRDR
ncbi:molybdopterin-guanine dinucleotide biosynthesis protein MobA [Agromyces rhizosphaerae]|uniref:Molybdopterin-guanine dinucleotide biosynthesis protein MobA n=1 Tax=Agromyces rhizosphaerae TaxID=88374 RepID=A0A9W6FPL0_9MICO|nr:molybdopterin-guanine dinucleotide biosynthesis protein MobA [Agromyces rhizosphaerae]